MSTRPDPERSGTVEIATRRCPNTYTCFWRLPIITCLSSDNDMLHSIPYRFSVSWVLLALSILLHFLVTPSPVLKSRPFPYCQYCLLQLFFFCFFSHLVFLTLLFSLPPSHNSDPGSQQALLPPCPLRFVPRIFIARRFQLFLPSSTRVELCLPTLGAVSS